MSDVRILLLGKFGQVGGELLGRLALLGKVVSCGKNECDLSNLETLRKTLAEAKPHFIVNAAAYTEVDNAEVEPGLAELINSSAVAVIAEYARTNDAMVIHYSTDYVFDGRLQRAYREDDLTHPLSTYGCSKLNGERAIAQSGCRYLIFRTSWVHSYSGKNFLKTMLGLMMTRETLSVVDDQWGAPTSASLISDVTMLAVMDRLSKRSLLNDGIYHLTPAGYTNWHGYACHIAERASFLGFRLRVALADIHPISSDLFPSAAVRPKNSRLDNSRLSSALGIALPDWQTDVDSTLATLAIGSSFANHSGRV